MIKICGLIYKRDTLYHIMNELHSISTKVIPIHTFGNAFANFNPRMHILSFLNCAQAGVLKTKPRKERQPKSCKTIQEKEREIQQ